MASRLRHDIAGALRRRRRPNFEGQLGHHERVVPDSDFKVRAGEVPLPRNSLATVTGPSPLAVVAAFRDAVLGGVVMKALLWIVAAVLIVAGVMLIAGVGEAALWFAVIAVGIAIVVLDRSRSHHA